MKRYEYQHRFPIPPGRLIALIDEDPYRDFIASNLPNLAGYERLEFRWEGKKRIKHVRMEFDSPVPGWIKRAMPGEGKGWMEERSILYPEERRMECEMRSSLTQGRRTIYFRDGADSSETLRLTQGDFRCTTPLLAGALERFVASEMEKNRDTEFDLTMRYLREHPPGSD